MWREFIQGFSGHCHLSPPASPAEISDLQCKLNIALPDDLRSLLEEANGASVSVTFPGLENEEPIELSLFWSVAEILEENEILHSFDTEMSDQFPPFASLLFFAREPDGDPVAFQISGEPMIIRMNHEDYGERTIRAASLREYLTLMLEILVEEDLGAN